MIRDEKVFLHLKNVRSLRLLCYGQYIHLVILKSAEKNCDAVVIMFCDVEG